MKVLFLLKKRSENYGIHNSSGLLNSVKFVSDALQHIGVDSKYVLVEDGNGIDKEVYFNKPEVVILEAYWALPSKVEELSKKYSKINWIVRSHSNMPFFVCEKMAIDWSFKYLAIKNVYVAANNKELYSSLLLLGHHKSKNILYLPNYYPVSDYDFIGRFKNKEVINIGCFGALRLLKNHINQALGALQFGHDRKMKIRFHINAQTLNGGDSTILHNLRELFSNIGQDHELVEHEWLEHECFKHLIKEHIDVGLQVSYSETFNIVAADFVDMLRPTVVSEEVSWMDSKFHANPNSVEDINAKIKKVLDPRCIPVIKENKKRLKDFSTKSLDIWRDTLADFKLSH